LRRPCKAKPIAREDMVITATSEVVEMPTIEATVMRSKALRPLLATLSANFIKVGLTRCEAWGSASTSSSTPSSPSWCCVLLLLKRVRMELLLLFPDLLMLTASSVACNHPSKHPTNFNPMNSTRTASKTFGKMFSKYAPAC